MNLNHEDFMSEAKRLGLEDYVSKPLFPELATNRDLDIVLYLKTVGVRDKSELNKKLHEHSNHFLSFPVQAQHIIGLGEKLKKYLDDTGYRSRVDEQVSALGRHDSEFLEGIFKKMMDPGKPLFSVAMGVKGINSPD